MSGNDFKGVGFGFNPDESQHYFLVSISSSAADIWISEHMSWSRDMWNRKIRAVTKETDERLRVISFPRPMGADRPSGDCGSSMPA